MKRNKLFQIPYKRTKKRMKRFTDTNIWDQEWFMELAPKLKCLVRFVFDKCDNAGVWSTNYILAGNYIGEKVTEVELLSIDGGKQFQKLKEGKIFVPGFIPFQYGELSEKCMPHKKVFNLLKKYGLLERVLKGYQKGTSTLEEEYKEEDKDKGLLGKNFPGKPFSSNMAEPPDVTVGAISEMIYRLKMKMVKKEQVLNYWHTWKVINLVGEKFYNTPNEVYTHFSNVCKNQDWNTVSPDKVAPKLKTAAELIAEREHKEKSRP